VASLRIGIWDKGGKMVQEHRIAGSSFGEMGPDKVITLVERELATRCNNLFRPLNSYINRVYELETVGRKRLVVKFYRPGRWTREAILDEHKFLSDLDAKEIPVVKPLKLKSGKTLASADGVWFGVFPKCGGRSIDEFSDDQWLQLGRLLGRVHRVGETSKARHRLVMAPHRSTYEQMQHLLGSPVVPPESRKPLERIISAIIEKTKPMFLDTECIRIHGDCHFSNIIHRPGQAFCIIDFDDMAMGPPVQDVWMLLPGDITEAYVELDLFLEGYETFRPFDRRSLKLIEPLRAMRFIHYMSWCARQVEGDGETRVVDGFGSREYWEREIADLEDQYDRINKAGEAVGNLF
jgi:Ser/Thr protein kinase RdoA (MazF antagonist)